MCTGIITWIVGVAEYFTLGGDTLHALFLLLFGGQLTKLTYAFMESEDLDKKHT